MSNSTRRNDYSRARGAAGSLTTPHLCLWLSVIESNALATYRRSSFIILGPETRRSPRVIQGERMESKLRRIYRLCVSGRLIIIERSVQPRPRHECTIDVTSEQIRSVRERLLNHLSARVSLFTDLCELEKQKKIARFVGLAECQKIINP